MCTSRTIFRSLLAGLVIFAVARLGRADEPSREYKVKAAFIYNFAQFVEWPAEVFPSDDAPLVIAIVGDDPFNGALDQAVAGKVVGARKVLIHHIAIGDDVTKCHILFVPVGDESIVSQAVGHPVLTIGESDSFPWKGGCIRFFSEDNKIRFEINLEAGDAAKIKVSSKLIRLARIFKK